MHVHVHVCHLKCPNYFLQHPYYRVDQRDAVEENESIPIHKQYKHDIALIELAEPVDLTSDYVRAICLPLSGDPQFNSNNIKRNDNSVPRDTLVNEYISRLDLPDAFKTKLNMVNHIRFKREQSNSVELFDVENSDQCWVTGWGDTKGKCNCHSWMTLYTSNDASYIHTKKPVCKMFIFENCEVQKLQLLIKCIVQSTKFSFFVFL